MLDLLRRRRAVVLLLVWAWVRVMLVLASDPFEMPDTASYTGAAWMRPPVGRVLLSLLPPLAYTVLSTAVTTAGFVLLAVTVRQRGVGRLGHALVAAIVLVSLSPMTMVFEHWLTPDSLLVGLGLLGVAAAVRAAESRRALAACVVTALALTLTKEVGVALAIVIVLVALVRGVDRRSAVAAIAACIVLFVVVVPPASARTGSAYWGRSDDSEISLDRFRILVVSLIWPDLGDDFAEVERRAEACGMPLIQLLFETFRVAGPVDLGDCDELWVAADELGQGDILLAHLRNPRHVGITVQRSFANDMSANMLWSDAELRPQWLSSGDRWVAGAVGIAPIGALGWCLVRRRARRLAALGLGTSALALVVGLMDPSAQDRHTIALRVLAAAIAAIAVADAQRPAGIADGPLECQSEEISSTGS